ncbi:MAG: hypothetical protein U0169_14415 [Polyangiaceae bacterium]
MRSFVVPSPVAPFFALSGVLTVGLAVGCSGTGPSSDDPGTGGAITGADGGTRDSGSSATGDGGTSTSPQKDGSTETPGTGDGGTPTGPAPKPPGEPAIKRGESFFGSTEKFNRYYTDRTWTPSKTIYVSASGNGDGTTRDTPMSATAGIAAAKPGTKVVFTKSTTAYQGCYELDEGGTYEAPIVIYAERNDDGTRGVEVKCCGTGRQTCFNLEAADYVAIDGFKVTGGFYGVRAVGSDFGAADHQKGVAILHVEGGGQSKDPVLSGHSDWLVAEDVLAHHAGSGDGHGIYLSNGSDWNIVRNVETHSNANSDFQVNADPEFACAGIDVMGAECSGSANEGKGRGASEFFLIENNFFHHDSVGPNFTSLRNSVIRNNFSGIHTKHGTSFWQETQNPALGAHHNTVEHNVFVGSNNRHALQFIENSGSNVVRNNLLVGVAVNGTNVTGSTTPILMEVDGTVSSNTYEGNFYVAGQLDGRTPGSNEFTQATFDAAWFTAFPTVLAGATFEGMVPKTGAPFLDKGAKLTTTATDASGRDRASPSDLGPFEAR